MRAIIFLALIVAIAIAAVDDNQKVSDFFPTIAQAVNVNGNSWVAEPNQFSSWTWGEVKSKLLMKTMVAQERYPASYIKKLKLKQQATSLPESWDMRVAYPECNKPVRDQGHCGSCWAVSGAETLTDLFCVATKGAFNKTLAPQDLVSCDWYNMGCNGGIPATAWFYLQHSGIVDEECFPYFSGNGTRGHCPATCVDGSNFKARKHYAKAFHHLGSMFHPSERPNKIAEYIMNHGAAQSGFSVYQDFLQYKSGVYKHTTGSNLGGHAVKIIGWGRDAVSSLDYWIVQNSWGTKWGMNGYFWIEKGVNECGFEGGVYSGEPLLK